MTTHYSHRARRGHVLLAATLLIAAGCSQLEVVYIVLSPTPNSTEGTSVAAAETPLPAQTAEATLEVTTDIASDELAPQITASAGVSIAAAPTPLDAVLPTEVISPELTLPVDLTPSVEVAPTETATPLTTPLPPGFPTPVMAEIQVAEQLFEHGRMFWLQPTGQIWVLTLTGEGRGNWTVYPDAFIESEPTLVPTITPVAGLIVPDRGFGKVWREIPAVREQLGFAVTPEFGYVSEYAYYAGGSIDASGAYAAGSGYHILYSLYDEQFRFDEADGTWRLGS